MTVLARDADGTPTIWCDPCIAPIIQALNDGGLETTASCCGHDHSPGLVSLRDGRYLMVLPDRAWFDLLCDFIHGRIGCKPGRECTACADALGEAGC
jgi:hypothetical protein